MNRCGVAMLRSLFVALVLLTSGAPRPAAAGLPDGVWTVYGSAIPGMACGDWFVRLTSMAGHLSGILSLSQANAPLENLILQPDGSFAGATRPGVVGTRYVRAYQVSGRFAGEQVNLHLQSELCPVRGGTAMRQGPPY